MIPQNKFARDSLLYACCADGLEGELLWRLSEALYVTESYGTVKVWGPNGEPLVERDRVNQRYVLANHQKYCARFSG